MTTAEALAEPDRTGDFSNRLPSGAATAGGATKPRPCWVTPEIRPFTDGHWSTLEDLYRIKVLAANPEATVRELLDLPELLQVMRDELAGLLRNGRAQERAAEVDRPFRTDPAGLDLDALREVSGLTLALVISDLGDRLYDGTVRLLHVQDLRALLWSFVWVRVSRTVEIYVREEAAGRINSVELPTESSALTIPSAEDTVLARLDLAERLDRLDDDAFDIVVNAAIGYTQQEIADHLGVSQPKVSRKLSEGRRTLRE